MARAKALHLVMEGEYIHIFTNPVGILLGADISRIKILQLLEKHDGKIEIAGPAARAMHHGICIFEDDHPLFIETDDDRINAFDPLPEE